MYFKLDIPTSTGRAVRRDSLRPHCACAIHEVLCALSSQLVAMVIVAESDACRAVVGQVQPAA